MGIIIIIQKYLQTEQDQLHPTLSHHATTN